MGPSNVLSALRRGCMSDAAGVYNNEVGFFKRFGPSQPNSFEQFTDLLALILIDFTAKCVYGKSIHNMI